MTKDAGGAGVDAVAGTDNSIERLQPETCQLNLADSRRYFASKSDCLRDSSSARSVFR